MIRKTSYFVNVPRPIKLFISDYPPAVLASGPLGRAVIGVDARVSFKLKEGKLSWSRIVGGSSRLSAQNKRQNNSLRRLFSNLFSDLSQPTRASIRLVGRGYRVSWSPTQRKAFLRIGYSGKKVVPLPRSVNLSVINRYNFDLWSLSPGQLRVLSLSVRGLREPSPYTAKGVLLNSEVIAKKEGKKSQY